MPQEDGTGPAGQGPMTGRGMGRCNGNSVPRFRNFGMGRGRRCCEFPTQSMTPEQEKISLQQELEMLKNAETNINARLKDIK